MKFPIPLKLFSVAVVSVAVVVDVDALVGYIPFSSFDATTACSTCGHTS